MTPSLLRQRRAPSPPERKREDVAYILDFLPYGYGPGYRGRRRAGHKGPVAQAVGERYFILLELSLLPGIQLNTGDPVYLGGGLDREVIRVTGRLSYDELTTTARAELPHVVEKIVKKREQDFVKFFNEAEPLTTKMHALELLRGIGKKTLWKILEERRKKPFTSFEDIRRRVKIDPLKLVVERIVDELREEQKHYLFVSPPRRRFPRYREFTGFS